MLFLCFAAELKQLRAVTAKVVAVGLIRARELLCSVLDDEDAEVRIYADIRCRWEVPVAGLLRPTHFESSGS